MLLCVTATAFLPVATAAPKVVLYNIRLSAVPAIAGKGMPITLTASVEFGGACCYTVYAHDVTAELNLSKRLVMTAGKTSQPVTSSDQTTPGRVAALPGGGLTKVILQWTLKSDEYGEYNASVRVKGYSIRSPEPDEIFDQTETLKIKIVAGASVSPPMFPHPPSVDRDTTIVVNVTSVSGGVRYVLLNYSFDNSTWKTITMEKVSVENDNWLATIPKQTQERILYFYMFSVNSLNQTFTTPLYTEKIKDYGQINAVGIAGNVTIIIGAISSIFIIGYMYTYSRKLAREKRSKGILCIGQDQIVPVNESSAELNWKQLLLTERRKLAMIVLAILTIVLLAIAIASGQFATIVSRTTNPLGS